MYILLQDLVFLKALLGTHENWKRGTEFLSIHSVTPLIHSIPDCLHSFYSDDFVTTIETMLMCVFLFTSSWKDVSCIIYKDF